MARERPICKEPGCRSQFVSSKYQGYCNVHAQRHGLIPEEDLVAMNKRREETQRQNELKREAAATDEEKLIITRETYKESLGEKHYHVGDILEEKQSAGEDAFSEESCKEILIDWTMSDPATRRPKTLKELADELAKPYFILIRWKKERWYINDIKKAMERKDLEAAPGIQRTRNTKAIAGDKSAIELFYKKNEFQSEPDSSLEDTIQEEAFREAQKITGSKGGVPHLGKNKDILEGLKN